MSLKLKCIYLEISQMKFHSKGFKRYLAKILCNNVLIMILIQLQWNFNYNWWWEKTTTIKNQTLNRIKRDFGSMLKLTQCSKLMPWLLRLFKRLVLRHLLKFTNEFTHEFLFHLDKPGRSITVASVKIFTQDVEEGWNCGLIEVSITSGNRECPKNRK